MGNVAPDGFTPIHAAAYAGNLAVVELLIKFRPEVVHLVDVQGRKALAVASKQGHVNVVAVLKNAMGIPNEDGSSIVFPIGKDAPVDLSGRTPLAWAMTSSAPLAIRNRTRLEQELFSPEDKSIVGIFTPPSYRMGGDRLASRATKPQLSSSLAPQITSNSLDDGLAITYGFSEMPGLRIEMEDAMCYHYPMRLKTGSTVGFFGVFDGHCDGGFASRFVADHVAEYFVQAEIWDSIETQSNEKDHPSSSASLIASALEFACIKADQELRNRYSAIGVNIIAGGSTGVMAVITTDCIVVANVGDSRCILVQKTSSIVGEHDVLEKGLNGLRLHDDETKVLQPSFSPEDGIVVTALSEDHKPNLPHELQRIEKAGYEVVSDRLDSALIWKIKKSESDKIAVSRAFGDFDYKDKNDLAAHEQAIICIPEITIHERKADLDMFLVL
jgi:serine/threonine protein phosphatase PrpC